MTKYLNAMAYGLVGLAGLDACVMLTRYGQAMNHMAQSAVAGFVARVLGF